jgi:hypothetical protein
MADTYIVEEQRITVTASGGRGPTGLQGPPGATGSTGPAGPQGDPGPAGADGPQGPIGLTGPQGPKGDTGDAGADGVAGVAGPKGDTGNTGPAGATGPKGDTGDPGPTGATGPAGPQGDPGPAGADGADGATGPQGSQGIQGPAGDTGPAGPTGPAGVDGKTILYGTAAPTTEGVDGDFYIRTTTNFIYGPKASGTWPSGISLVGPTGATGPEGPQGEPGADASNAIEVVLKTSNFTFALTEANNYVRVSSASTVVATIPNDADVAFEIGTVIHIRQAGEGQVEVFPAAGVDLLSAETYNLRKQHSSGSLIKVAANTWDLTGDLEVLA